MTFYQVWLEEIQNPEFIGFLAFIWLTVTGITILATISIIRIFKPVAINYSQRTPKGDTYYANTNRKP